MYLKRWPQAHYVKMSFWKTDVGFVDNYSSRCRSTSRQGQILSAKAETPEIQKEALQRYIGFLNY